MLKRTFDVCAALLGITLLAPVLLLVACLIMATSSGGVFYRGSRVGRYGRTFRIFKFRSMVANAESLGGSSTSDSDMRITSVGRLIRKFKVDELPQLFNVLRGDMSFVGPRPEVQEYVDLYTAEERELLRLRPGITDWASIWNSDEGAVLAGAADPDQAYLEHIRPTKLTLQLKYCRESSLWTDVKLLCYTLYKILNRDWVPDELKAYPCLIPVVQHAAQARQAA